MFIVDSYLFRNLGQYFLISKGSNIREYLSLYLRSERYFHMNLEKKIMLSANIHDSSKQKDNFQSILLEQTYIIYHNIMLKTKLNINQYKSESEQIKKKDKTIIKMQKIHAI